MVIPFDLCVSPAGVIPEDEAALFVCDFYGGYDLRNIQRVCVFDEDSVEVVVRFCLFEFGAFDKQDVHFFCARGGDGMCAVDLSRDVFFVGAVNEMVGYCDCVEAFGPGFVNSPGGPYFAVRKDGMSVEVANKRFVSVDVREVVCAAYLCGSVRVRK